ncbi:MAG TPA: hypothetical protein DCM57_04100 [Treponema sp.]|nr:hypothetical protein [Treponema sp.]
MDGGKIGERSQTTAAGFRVFCTTKIQALQENGNRQFILCTTSSEALLKVIMQRGTGTGTRVTSIHPTIFFASTTNHTIG